MKICRFLRSAFFVITILIVMGQSRGRADEPLYRQTEICPVYSQVFNPPVYVSPSPVWLSTTTTYSPPVYTTVGPPVYTETLAPPVYVPNSTVIYPPVIIRRPFTRSLIIP